MAAVGVEPLVQWGSLPGDLLERVWSRLPTRRDRCGRGGTILTAHLAGGGAARPRPIAGGGGSVGGGRATGGWGGRRALRRCAAPTARPPAAPPKTPAGWRWSRCATTGARWRAHRARCGQSCWPTCRQQSACGGAAASARCCRGWSGGRGQSHSWRSSWMTRASGEYARACRAVGRRPIPLAHSPPTPPPPPACCRPDAAALLTQLRPSLRRLSIEGADSECELIEGPAFLFNLRGLTSLHLKNAVGERVGSAPRGGRRARSHPHCSSTPRASHVRPPPPAHACAQARSTRGSLS